jgi:hypothetical protein
MCTHTHTQNTHTHTHTPSDRLAGRAAAVSTPLELIDIDLKEERRIWDEEEVLEKAEGYCLCKIACAHMSLNEGTDISLSALL